jgi:hypothetical protein
MEDEIGSTGSTYGGMKKHRKLSENLKGRDCLGNVSIDERTPLK